MTILYHILPILWYFVLAHWGIECAVLVACLFYLVIVTELGPGDFTGNGIVVGSAKNFDNRSLTMMIEQLDAALKGVTAVDPSVTKNLGTLQEQEANRSSSGLTFGVPGSIEKSNSATPSGSDNNKASEKTATAAAADIPSPGGLKATLPSFGFAAPDALADQLDLSYQIFNLRILNERSLSDRLYPGGTRMQVVLGFQVSINPPRGSENCAAIIEIGLQLNGSDDPVSIVAMIPQEKTYNAASLSSEGRSIDGSIVSKVLTIGAKGARQQDNVYLHRDTDTVAFERSTQSEAAAFGLRKPRAASLPTVLGWEFRPVLGKRTVTPGSRQMLAVVALPCTDSQSRILNVQTRAFWRNYDRKSQVSSVRWHGWPFPGRLGAVPAWRDASLTIEPPVVTESRLGPKIRRISWVNAGNGIAVVLIRGRNFFTGTEITIGGQAHRSEETNLTIKSDSALEVRTTIAALNEGEAVLSGRFGPTIPLVVNPDKLPVKSICMESATFDLQPNDAFIRVAVIIAPAEITVGNRISRRELEKLPDPILYLNGQPLFGAYDYNDCHSLRVPQPVLANRPTDSVNIQAWAPATSFKGAGSVIAFKVPFCGEDWVASSVVRLPEGPSLTVLSRESTTTTLLLSVPRTFGPPAWNLVLDRKYTTADAQLTEIDPLHLRFIVANNVLSEYTQVILRNGTINTYLLDLPQNAPVQRPRIDSALDTPIALQGKNGVCVWKGSQLALVTVATIDNASAAFTVHGGGEQISVFIPASAAVAGKHEVNFLFSGGSLPASFFVIDEMPNRA